MVYRSIICVTALYSALIICNAQKTDSEPSSYNTMHSLCDSAKRHIDDNQYRDAIPLLQEALTIEHTDTRTQLLLAHALLQEKQYAGALTIYKNIITLYPHNADIYCNMGVCAYYLEDSQSAIRYFEQSLAENPALIYAHLHLIGTLEKNGQYEQALDSCKRLLTIHPTQREGLLSAGILTKQLERFEDAAWYYRTLYNQYPDDTQAMIELASVLIVLEEYEEALTLFTKALSVHPESISIFYNLGFTLKKLGHLDQAIAIYKQIIAQKPDYPLAHFSLGLAYLAQGNFQAGLPEYEWRWKVYNNEGRSTKLIPQWDGSPLAGKKIYVYAEQGYGDTFQFMRYLQELKQQGAYILFGPQPALVQFMRHILYIDEVTSPRDSILECDYQAPLLSLPLLCNTTLETIPSGDRYLQIDPAVVELWRPTFDAIPRSTMRVGICWHGNSQYKDISLRRTVTQKSCPLALFSLLADVPNVRLFSLQKISGIAELETLDDASFLSIFPETIDTYNGRFVDTAAIISQLDLVVTVDTAIAHLAAALGVETWTLLPEPADWRWMVNRSDTPWYPTMRLFRQTERGDWPSLMTEVRDALAEKTRNKNI